MDRFRSYLPGHRRSRGIKFQPNQTRTALSRRQMGNSVYMGAMLSCRPIQATLGKYVGGHRKSHCLKFHPNRIRIGLSRGSKHNR